MTYAFLLYPHANIRYRQSLLQLAVQELSMTLSALGREAEVVPQKMGGAMFLTFEAAKLTERDMRMLSQLASVYMLFEMEDGKLTTLERTHPNYVGEDLPALLKYKGKTNEMFTDTMLTMALAASAFMPVHDSQLVVCDPMAGRLPRRRDRNRQGGCERSGGLYDALSGISPHQVQTDGQRAYGARPGRRAGKLVCVFRLCGTF